MEVKAALLLQPPPPALRAALPGGKKLSRFVDAHGQKGMMGVRRVQKSSQKVLTANSTLIMGIGIFCPYFLVGREIQR